MDNIKTSYRQIMKATSIFGGVQFFNIIITLIRSKFVAIFLGAAGIGMMGLFQTSITLIYTISHLGLSSSAVRDISAANAKGDVLKISRVILSFSRWVWFTGLIGSILTVIFSSVLSEISFGNNNYTLEYIILSSVVVMTALSNSQNTLLKGMRKVSEIAKANIIGSIIGLFFSIPIYYYLGKRGIVPSLVLSSLFTLLTSWHFARQIKTQKQSIPFKVSLLEGISMVKLGVMMTISGFLSILSNFLINTYISQRSGMNDVGLYQAGISISTKYVSLIFTAMAMDYYPRLSMISNDNSKIKNEVNQQAEIALLMMAPILVMLISSMPLVVKLLYTSEFLPVVEFVQWLTIGILVKAISWPIGYIMLAKGESKIYLFSEVVANTITLLLCIAGYKIYGLKGIGIFLTISNILILLSVLIICTKKYEFSIEKEVFKIFSIQALFCFLALFLALYLGFPNAYYSGFILFILASFYSFKKLNEKVGLIKSIRTKIS